VDGLYPKKPAGLDPGKISLMYVQSEDDAIKYEMKSSKFRDAAGGNHASKLTAKWSQNSNMPYYDSVLSQSSPKSFSIDGFKTYLMVYHDWDPSSQNHLPYGDGGIYKAYQNELWQAKYRTLRFKCYQKRQRFYSNEMNNLQKQFDNVVVSVEVPDSDPIRTIDVPSEGLQAYLNELRDMNPDTTKQHTMIIAGPDKLTDDEIESLKSTGAEVTRLFGNYVHRRIDQERPGKNGC
jgi:hypothetical protein